MLFLLFILCSQFVVLSASDSVKKEPIEQAEQESIEQEKKLAQKWRDNCKSPGFLNPETCPFYKVYLELSLSNAKHPELIALYQESLALIEAYEQQQKKVRLTVDEEAEKKKSEKLAALKRGDSSEHSASDSSTSSQLSSVDHKEVKQVVSLHSPDDDIQKYISMHDKIFFVFNEGEQAALFVKDRLLDQSETLDAAIQRKKNEYIKMGYTKIEVFKDIQSYFVKYPMLCTFCCLAIYPNILKQDFKRFQTTKIFEDFKKIIDFQKLQKEIQLLPADDSEAPLLDTIKRNGPFIEAAMKKIEEEKQQAKRAAELKEKQELQVQKADDGKEAAVLEKRGDSAEHSVSRSASSPQGPVDPQKLEQVPSRLFSHPADKENMERAEQVIRNILEVFKDPNGVTKEFCLNIKKVLVPLAVLAIRHPGFRALYEEVLVVLEAQEARFDAAAKDDKDSGKKSVVLQQQKKVPLTADEKKAMTEMGDRFKKLEERLSPLRKSSKGGDDLLLLCQEFDGRKKEFENSKKKGFFAAQQRVSLSQYLQEAAEAISMMENKLKSPAKQTEAAQKKPAEAEKKKLAEAAQKKSKEVVVEKRGDSAEHSASDSSASSQLSFVDHKRLEQVLSPSHSDPVVKQSIEALKKTILSLTEDFKKLGFLNEAKCRYYKWYLQQVCLPAAKHPEIIALHQEQLAVLEAYEQQQKKVSLTADEDAAKIGDKQETDSGFYDDIQKYIDMHHIIFFVCNDGEEVTFLIRNRRFDQTETIDAQIEREKKECIKEGWKKVEAFKDVKSFFVQYPFRCLECCCFYYPNLFKQEFEKLQTTQIFKDFEKSKKFQKPQQYIQLLPPNSREDSVLKGIKRDGLLRDVAMAMEKPEEEKQQAKRAVELQLDKKQELQVQKADDGKEAAVLEKRGDSAEHSVSRSASSPQGPVDPQKLEQEPSLLLSGPAVKEFIEKAKQVVRDMIEDCKDPDYVTKEMCLEYKIVLGQLAPSALYDPEFRALYQELLVLIKAQEARLDAATKDDKASGKKSVVLQQQKKVPLTEDEEKAMTEMGDRFKKLEERLSPLRKSSKGGDDLLLLLQEFDGRKKEFENCKKKGLFPAQQRVSLSQYLQEAAEAISLMENKLKSPAKQTEAASKKLAGAAQKKPAEAEKKKLAEAAQKKSKEVVVEKRGDSAEHSVSHSSTQSQDHQKVEPVPSLHSPDDDMQRYINMQDKAFFVFNEGKEAGLYVRDRQSDLSETFDVAIQKHRDDEYVKHGYQQIETFRDIESFFAKHPLLCMLFCFAMYPNILKPDLERLQKTEEFKEFEKTEEFQKLQKELQRLDPSTICTDEPWLLQLIKEKRLSIEERVQKVQQAAELTEKQELQVQKAGHEKKEDKRVDLFESTYGETQDKRVDLFEYTYDGLCKDREIYDFDYHGFVFVLGDKNKKFAFFRYPKSFSLNKREQCIQAQIKEYTDKGYEKIEVIHALDLDKKFPGLVQEIYEANKSFFEGQIQQKEEKVKDKQKKMFAAEFFIKEEARGRAEIEQEIVAALVRMNSDQKIDAFKIQDQEELNAALALSVSLQRSELGHQPSGKHDSKKEKNIDDQSSPKFLTSQPNPVSLRRTMAEQVTALSRWFEGMEKIANCPDFGEVSVDLSRLKPQFKEQRKQSDDSADDSLEACNQRLREIIRKKDEIEKRFDGIEENDEFDRYYLIAKKSDGSEKECQLFKFHKGISEERRNRSLVAIREGFEKDGYDRECPALSLTEFLKKDPQAALELVGSHPMLIKEAKKIKDRFPGVKI
jgi:hypothetical protein